MSGLVQLDSSVLSAAPAAGPPIDTFGRTHSDLRISVTDRCNIRCFYCMPESGAEYAPLASQLTFEETVRFAQVAVSLGFDKIRITGGEPLLRPRVTELIAALSRLPGLRDLALTTNAVLLRAHAKPLYDAGLRRLNIHLDTLDRERFRAITRRDDLPGVLAGIEAAQRCGFTIKLNAVAVKNLTEPDVVPLVRFGRENGFEVRFIEFMPLDSRKIWSMDRVLTADDLIGLLAAEFGPLSEVPDADPRAPATEYEFDNGDRVGFIASVSRPFCLNCNRLRLTSDGKLRNCLFALEELDIRQLLRQPGREREIEQAIRTNVWRKWAGHDINRSTFAAPQRPMYSIGG